MRTTFQSMTAKHPGHVRAHDDTVAAGPCDCAALLGARASHFTAPITAASTDGFVSAA
jgi:hypothetical protein